MTKEQLEARLAELRAERERLILNVNAFNGAIEENERWLRLLEAEK